MFLSTDHATYICTPPFAADSLFRKYTFARNINQNQPIKKNPQTLKQVTFK